MYFLESTERGQDATAYPRRVLALRWGKYLDLGVLLGEFLHFVQQAITKACYKY